WESFKCAVNPEIVESNRCSIEGTDRSIITAEFKYNREFPQLNASFLLRLPRPPTNEFHTIMDLNIDVCKFYTSTKRNKFLTIAYRSMMKDSNLPNKCPQAKGFYYFRNMNIGANVPPFLPQTDFQVEFNYFLPKHSILNISLSGRLKE
ncbi:hypothetical protein KR215_006139, partial [Drosophila sulfurigaster]